MRILTASRAFTEDCKKSLTRQLLARPPLAKVVLMCFSFVMDRASLDQLFEEHRGRAYTRKLSFSTVVYLIRDALISRQQGTRRHLERAKAQQQLPASVVASVLCRLWPRLASFILLRF